MKAPRSPGARAVAFNLVGLLGFVVQLGLLWLLVHLFGVGVLTATALAVEGAVAHNFVWHWHWTWSDRVPPPGGRIACFFRFNATNGAVSLLVNVALMALLTLVLHLPYLLANLGAVGCASLANYLLGDRVVFPSGARPWRDTSVCGPANSSENMSAWSVVGWSDGRWSRGPKMRSDAVWRRG